MMFLLYLLLTFAALVLAAWVSPARGRALVLALVALGWGVGTFNTLIEAVAFGVMPLEAAAIQCVVALLVFAVFAAGAVAVAGRLRGEGAPPVRPRVTVLRLAGVVLGYELLYFGAGLLVFPYVADFYATRTLPPLGLVAGLQVPRALIFAASAWLWLRTGPRAAPLVLGIAFSVIGGIAPLLPENPYMPADVRLAHGIETGASNFLFGLLLGWLLRAKPAG